MYLGDFVAGQTIYFKWGTVVDGSGSVTRATNGTIRIYKNGLDTQRSSANGVTDTEDFDSLTGFHHLAIDLSDNTDAGFYAAASDYMVMVTGMVIGGLTLNVPLCSFSIENRNDKADVREYGGSAGTFASGRPEVNATHAGGTAWGSGAITAASIAADAITAAKIATGAIDADAIADNAIDAGAIATGALTAAKFAAGAIDAAALAADAGTEIATAVWASATRSLTILDEDSTTLDLDATIRAAVGLAAANLDTQIGDLPTNAELATSQAAADDATLAAIAALNNISAAQVNAEVDTAIADAALATAANLATVAGYLDTEIAAILADTNELQTDWANGGRLDLILDARASQTSVDTVDTVVDAIKVTTDKLDDTLEDDAGTFRFTTNSLEQAPTGGSAPSAADIRAEIDANSTQLAAILTDTGTTLDGKIDAIKAKTDSLTFTVANKVDSNIKSVADTTVTGAGTAGDPWGP